MPALPLSRGTVRRLISSPLARLLAGPPPKNDRGDELDRTIHQMLHLANRLGTSRLDQLGPARARTRFREDIVLADVEPTRLHRVEDRYLDGPSGELRVRVYRPRARRAAQPALVYVHGGGFVVGDVEAYDGLCRFLAHRADMTVLSVEYGLAPEHPFPEPVADTVFAYRWIVDNARELGVDPNRLAVGGDSAGGNLSAELCLELRGGDVPVPAFQLLIYPATDMTRSMDSHRLFARGFFLEEATVDWFLANYLTSPQQETDPRASPICVADLSGLPPAHVVVAGFDPLRDEGEAYASALMAAGVPTTLRCYGSLIHGFANLGGLCAAARWAVEDMADVLRRAMHA